MSNTPQCFYVPDLDKEEILALKAVGAGEADAYNQRLALSVIVNKFCRAHDILYIPGAPDMTTFLNGRAFPGMQILKHLNVPIGQLINEDKDNG